MNRKSNRIIVILFFLLSIMAPIFCFSQVAKVKIEKIGVLDSNTDYFDLEQGNYAYRANGLEGVAIYNVSDKSKAVKIGNFSLPGSAEHIQVVGQWLYASAGKNFYIIDISNPVSPVLKNVYTAKKEIVEFGLYGNYALLGHNSSTEINVLDLLTVIDISDPANPKKTGTFELPGIDYANYWQIVKFVISGRYALVNLYSSVLNLGTDSDLYIIDLLNPTAPSLVGKYSFGSIPPINKFKNPEVIDYVDYGSFLYLVNQYSGIQVLDITDPSFPNLVNEGVNVPNICQVERSGHYIFVRQTNALLIFNVTNPAAPVPVGSWMSEEELINIRVSGNLVALETYHGFVRILDVSNPATPTLIREKHVELADKRIGDFSGNYGYIVDTMGGMKIVDVSTPGAPALKSFYNNYSKGTPGFLGVSGNYAFTTEGGKFNVIDISNKSKPVVTGSVATALTSYIGISGDYVYLHDISTFDIIDISNKTKPRVTKNFNTGYFIGLPRVIGNYIYIRDIDSESLRIFDVTDKSNPAKSGTLGFTDSISNMEFFGDYVIIVTGYELHIVDIANKSNPVQVGSITIDLSSESLAISGSYLYVTGYEGIRVIDISNPKNPVLIGSYNGFNGYYLGFYEGKISGNYLVVSRKVYSNNSLCIFDISDPSSPQLVGMFDVFEKNIWDYPSFYVQGEYIYLVDGGKFYVLKIESNNTPWIRVSQPNGGEIIYITGAPVKIYWLESGLNGNVTIDLYKSGQFLMNLATVGAETGFYSTQFPSTIPNSDDYTLRIYQGSVEDFSDSFFTIRTNVSCPIYEFNEKHIQFMTSLGANPASKTISISSNVSSDASPWTIETSQSWLQVTPNSGAGAQTIQVSANASGLSTGTYYGTVTLYIPNAYNSKIILNVLLKVFKILPQVSLDKKNLVFNITKNGGVESQTFSIDCGGEPIEWNADSNIKNLYVGPSYGKGNKTITVIPDPGFAFKPGTTTGKITVSSLDALNTPQEINVTVIKEKSDPPFGEFSTPEDGSSLYNSIPVTGWALDDFGIESVKIYLEQNSALIYIGDAIFIEGARPDVEIAFPGYPENNKAGWGYMLLTHFLPNGGNGTYTLTAKATDTEGNEVTLGTKTIAIDNAHAVKPFGAIDTPTQGGAALGKDFVNFGWALTPQPNTIPIDGSTINVVIDGVVKGHPGYNVYRSDIAGLFPGYANTLGAIGYYYLDTTKLTSGQHTIAWTVADNAGNTDGIGSRYFTVMNAPTSGDEMSSMREKGIDTTELCPDEGDVNRIEIKELERVEINLPGAGDLEGYMMVGDELRELPIGSTLDKEKGVFYWQPGPGFVGEYRLLFVEKGNEGHIIKKNIVVNIKPR